MAMRVLRGASGGSGLGVVVGEADVPSGVIYRVSGPAGPAGPKGVDAGGALTTGGLASVVSGAPSKGLPVDADVLPLVDSERSGGLAGLSLANLKAAISAAFVTLSGKQVVADKTFVAPRVSGSAAAAAVIAVDGTDANIGLDLQGKGTGALTYMGRVVVTDAVVHGSGLKATPVDADELALLDSADSFGVKKLSWASLKAALLAWFGPVTATLTNKTLDGTKNTFTNLPPSATAVNAERLVYQNYTVGPNLLPDPNFEDLTFFLNSGAIRGEYSTEQKRSGTHSLKMTGDGVNVKANWLVASKTGNTGFLAYAGQKFYAEFWVWIDPAHSGAGDVRLQINVVGTAGTFSNVAVTAAVSTLTKGSWQKVSGEMVLPAGTISVSPQIALTGAGSTPAAAGDIVYVDTMTLVDITAPADTVTLTGAQSLTNKTLVSPTITGSPVVNGAPICTRVAVPATATATGTPGQVAVDATHIYVCTAANTWVRSAAAAW